MDLFVNYVIEHKIVVGQGELKKKEIEESAISNSSVPPKIWKRYVDVSFCIIGQARPGGGGGGSGIPINPIFSPQDTNIP